ncbi:MATE family efflux transporter [Terrimonas rubra]|uniref:Multidrug export protein MepA n=1 Tax=Terrimonas rubra TaxID=1035890 RepID=A0ABW6A211_9BACT
MSGKRQMILQDDLWRLMVRLSLPGIVGMLVIAVNSFVDALYVGRFVGAEALAGVSMTIPLTVLNTALLNLVAAGANSLLSRSIGSEDTATQDSVFAHILLLCIAVSVLLMVPGIFFAEEVIGITGATGRVLHHGVEYYTISQAGCFFSIFGLVSSGLIRAEGQIKRAMFISISGVLINVLLNPVFIVWLKMGVQGSAWATVLSMFFYCLLTTRYFQSGKSVVKIRLGLQIWKKQIFRDILAVGVSAMLMQLSSFIRQLFLFKAVTRYGTDTQVALFSAVYRLFTFSVIPVFGILQSLQPVVGINYGAGQQKRSRAAVAVFLTGCIVLMLVIALPSFIFPREVLSLLVPGITLNAGGLFYFRMVLIILLMAPVSSVSIVYLQATGNATWSAWLAGGRELVLFLPLVLLLPQLYGHAGVYYTLVIENFLYMLIVLMVLRYYMKNMPVLDGSSNSFTLSFRFFHLFNRKAGK